MPFFRACIWCHSRTKRKCLLTNITPRSSATGRSLRLLPLVVHLSFPALVALLCGQPLTSNVSNQKVAARRLMCISSAPSQTKEKTMARCTAPVRGHSSAAARANCPACSSRYGGSQQLRWRLQFVLPVGQQLQRWWKINWERQVARWFVRLVHASSGGVAHAGPRGC